MQNRDVLAFEGKVLDVRLVEMQLKNSGIACRTVEAQEGPRVFTTSKVFVAGPDSDAAKKIIDIYLKDSQPQFQFKPVNVIILISFLALFLFTIIVAIVQAV
ncbi:MAG: hypothetical protein GF350_05860 [Chitinivibrionales bacterium]|nr:hypothetical protein [Chitinivibrionales bacterium]